jgi:hypothetical protein
MVAIITMLPQVQKRRARGSLPGITPFTMPRGSHFLSSDMVSTSHELLMTAEEFFRNAFFCLFILMPLIDLYDEISFFAATTNANFTIGTDSLTQNEWDTLAFDFVNSCNNRKRL